MIKTGQIEEVQKLIGLLGKQVKMLVYNSLELSYFSRGSWSYYDVLNMSAAEREIATDFINRRLEIAAKMMHPVF